MPGEAPDFTVADIGIEVTEYFRPGKISGLPLQEQEALKFQISSVATDEAKSSIAPNLVASIFFARNYRILKKDVQAVARSIVNVMSQLLVTEVGWSSTIRNDGQLPACVDSIVVYAPSGLKEPAVTCTDATFVPEIDPEEIARIVASKERKISAYRRRCSEIWLLIMVDGFRMSSVATLPSEPANVTTSFDRVVVLCSRGAVSHQHELGAVLSN